MIKTQEELKLYLEKELLDDFSNFRKRAIDFLIYYFDNKSNTIVFKDVVPLPEASIRKFPKISKSTELPVSDFTIMLMGAFDYEHDTYYPLKQELDYHIYFTDEEKSDDENKDKTKE